MVIDRPVRPPLIPADKGGPAGEVDLMVNGVDAVSLAG